MRQLMLRPVLHSYEYGKDFINEFDISENALILTNKTIFNPYFGALDIKANVLFVERYGDGDASDATAEAILADIGKEEHRRIIALGDPDVIALAKLLALADNTPPDGLFDQNTPAIKNRELVVVPTVCGPGDEMTNRASLYFKKRGLRLELTSDSLYADSVVLIPQLLEGMPYRLFAAASLDTLVHAAESFVSPRATAYTRLFAREAISTVISGYRDIVRDGEMARVRHLPGFLAAASQAGIAFDNTGPGAIHAMSRPVEDKYRPARGETNYTIFSGVFDAYRSRESGVTADLDRILAGAMGCAPDEADRELALLLDSIYPHQPLRQLGMTEEDIGHFAEAATSRKDRAITNSFAPLGAGEVQDIYRKML